MSYGRSSFLRYLAYRVAGSLVVALVLGTVYALAGSR